MEPRPVKEWSMLQNRFGETGGRKAAQGLIKRNLAVHERVDPFFS